MPKPAVPPIRFLSGWRTSGLVNTTLIWILSITIIALLFSSAWRLGSGWRSLAQAAVLITGPCSAVSRTNVLLHVALNAIATLVIASSNFFMQVLCAPTRENVAKAHRQGRYVEIAVQSIHNLRYISPWKVAFWLTLAATAVPLHLFFNSCITESIASTDFQLIVATESFLNNGTAYEVPSPGTDYLNLNSNFDVQNYGRYNSFLVNISTAASRWQRIDTRECLDIYDNLVEPLTAHRHVVMIVRNEGDVRTVGWNGSAISRYYSMSMSTVINSIWTVQPFQRTDYFVGRRHQQQQNLSPEVFEYLDWGNWIRNVIRIDPNSSIITPDPEFFVPSQPRLVADYCLAEPFVAPCELHVQNLMMLIVCVFCLIKAVVCLVTMVQFRKHDPLITVGDAIESFIVTPDSTTENMCWLSRRPEGSRELWSVRCGWAQGPRQWRRQRHRLGAAVPWRVWAFSYFCILFMLGVAVFQIATHRNTHPWSSSVFGPSTANGDVTQKFSWTKTPVGAAVQINSVQVGLSIAYLAYNGIFTRMLSEREWAKFGLSFRSLRVTYPKGSQRSTYRLQLPYRWSIPLMFVSGTMHWLVSNAAYPRSYISYPALPPYTASKPSGETGVGFSTRATVTTFVVGFTFAVVPAVLAWWRLPGNMVLAANNSAVISAACHSIPTEITELVEIESSREGLLDSANDQDINGARGTRSPGQILYNMSIHSLKWGVVSKSGATANQPGHFAFGTMDQEIYSPVEGDWYACHYHR